MHFYITTKMFYLQENIQILYKFISTWSTTLFIDKLHILHFMHKLDPHFSLVFLCSRLHQPWPSIWKQSIMSEENIIYVKTFVILGFPGLPSNYHGLVSVVMFCVYVCTLMGNGIFVALFIREKNLKKPMYYIMLNLAASYVLFSTTTLPKIIARYWFGDGSISFAGSFIQMQFVHYFGSVNALVLAVMAFDRYVAICNPLRYANIVKESTIWGLSVASWLVAEPTVLTTVIRATNCASNTIIQCFCDHVSVTKRNNLCLFSFSFSYGYAAHTTSIYFVLLWFYYYHSVSNFSTCSSQLIIITLFFYPGV